MGLIGMLGWAITMNGQRPWLGDAKLVAKAWPAGRPIARADEDIDVRGIHARAFETLTDEQIELFHVQTLIVVNRSVSAFITCGAR